MTQMPLFQLSSWTVSSLTQYIRQMLESDYNLQELWVAGEVSNCRKPSSGHLYFTLKDKQASLACVMWRSSVQRLRFPIKDGDAVEVHGSIGVYETSGAYQLYADQIRPTGEGILYQEFLRLKARLEAEGLFDVERKRQIPHMPHRIGLVTSDTGAALRDMLNTIRRRFPLVEVVLAPASVQGDGAAPAIVAGIEALNRRVQPDVIIVGRGGGSIEDLWAFNDERVARAIVASVAPVISGVGHETDFTIADFAADQRAATPTAAAELATPDRTDLLDALGELLDRLNSSARAALTGPRWQFMELQNRLQMRSPHLRLRSDRQRVDGLQRQAAIALEHHLRLKRARLNALEQRLAALDPRAVLGRGYALLQKKDGSFVRSKDQVRVGEALSVQVVDGRFGVRVENREGKDVRGQTGSS